MVKPLQAAVGLDAAVFADPQEDDAVDGPLHGEIQVAAGNARVPQGDVPRQHVAPRFDLDEKRRIDLGRPLLDLLRGDELFQRSAANGLRRKEVEQFVPAVEILRVIEEDDAGGSRLVVLFRPNAAIVNGELLEIGEDAHRQLGRPGVAAELIGRAGGVADIDRRLLRLDEEAADAAACAEAVVRGLGPPADADRVFVNDLLVGLGVALAVEDVPAQGLEEGVEELAAKLRFVVGAGAVRLDLGLKTLDQFLHDRRCCHRYNLSKNGLNQLFG